jgi:hypothetical protein
MLIHVHRRVRVLRPERRCEQRMHESCGSPTHRLDRSLTNVDDTCLFSVRARPPAKDMHERDSSSPRRAQPESSSSEPAAVSPNARTRCASPPVHPGLSNTPSNRTSPAHGANPIRPNTAPRIRLIPSNRGPSQPTGLTQSDPGYLIQGDPFPSTTEP